MNRFYVLIVPSGIETHFRNFKDIRSLVLIVPSGIETWFQPKDGKAATIVLIVPSGIETIAECERATALIGINCT